MSQKGFEDPRGDTHRRTFPLDVLQAALLKRMRELASADLFTDPTAGLLADATAKVSAIERKLKVAVERFEADPENATWAGKVDEYDRERRAAVRELSHVRAEATNPLPARWEEAVELMGQTEPERLRQSLATLIDDVRVLIVKRGQTRLAAVQVFFKGGSERSFLVRWTRSVSLPRCKKPEVVNVYSFVRHPNVALPNGGTGIAPGLDLRNAEDVRQAELALQGLDWNSHLLEYADGREIPGDVRCWLGCLEWNHS
ncbi:hypothetical protein [Gemmata sp.]|uniref:hypothetical protein n=1 Tax=Gemmata sp. TaxID=1914242 RepID=UPI003F71694F